jgi:hypothetical protein
MSSIATTDPARLAYPAEAWVREYAVERAEGTSALRGLIVGAALSLPLWALLIAGGTAIFSALS